MGDAIGLSRRRHRLPILALPLAALAFALPVSRAAARDAYVTNFEDDTVSVINTQTNEVVGSPISVGVGPYEIAITPDGREAYVTNYNGGSVSVIDTRTKQAGTPILVGGRPNGVAISPDGKRAYVVDEELGEVSVIDTRTKEVVGTPIKVGKSPFTIAIAPDGKTAYVSNRESGNVSVIDTQTNEVVGAPIKVGKEPHGLAITPDGKALYVVDRFPNSVAVVDTQTKQVVGSEIAVGQHPVGIAIAPSGGTAYVSNSNSESVSVIDIHANQVIGSPVTVGGDPEGIAVTPNGRTVLVANYESENVSAIDTQTNLVPGAPTTVGSGPSAIAIVPAQAPLASFTSAGGHAFRPGVPVAFDASASSDPEGAIASFQWAFGDGKSATLSGPGAKHAYAAPGTYTATLAVTDADGCSTALLFTGQTAFCDGAASATQSQTIVVAYPGVRVRCPKSARPKGCRFKLQAFSKRHKGVPETSVARAKAKPGKAAIVSLKSTKKFRSKLAGARKALVKETTVAGGRTRTGFRVLKIVR